MAFDRILMLIEILLFIVIVIQGEQIKFYERGVYRLYSDREKERREWRQAKQKQASKKSELISTPTQEIPKTPEP